MASMLSAGLMITVLLALAQSIETSEQLIKLFEWGPGEVTFSWKDPWAQKFLLQTNKYIRKNNVPLGIALHPHEPVIFVTVPRWKLGVASTLNWVPIGTGNLKEPLRPYPSWDLNDIYGNTSAPYKIISVIRIFIDACDRLWVVDNGDDDKCGERRQLQPPKLLVFNLKTNVLIHMHVFDSTIVTQNSSFGKIVVDVTEKDCGNAFAYITDVRGSGLVVYDYRKDKSFKVSNIYFQNGACVNKYSFGGTIRETGNSIDGICLSGMYTDGYRNLYINTHNSNKQYITSTQFLQTEEYRRRPDIIYYLGEKCNDCLSGGAQVIDEKTGVMFYGDLNNDRISCWNGDHKNFSPSTQAQIASSHELNYVSDMVINRQRELVTISCQLREFFHTDNGVTTRIFAGRVENLVKGTNCQPKYTKC